jgi:hypothetical protein
VGIFEQQSKVLKENGWTDYYHPDNWVKVEWFNNPSINVDWAGVSMDKAWEIVNKDNHQKLKNQYE